jgi:CubicO group peptidase (beta-lactamase class C family)
MKINKYLPLLLITLVLFGCSGGNGNGDTDNSRNEQIAQIKQVLAEAKEEYGLSAIVYGVWDGNREMLTGTMGTSNNAPAHPTMNYRAGGVTEIMQGTILMRLIEENKYGITLDDPIAKWFPTFPYAQQVTLRMLGNSTAGYFDFLNSAQVLNDPDLYTKNWDPMDLITIGVTAPIMFEPGSQFSYSHTNFCILGLALEKITNKSLQQLVDEYIATPLNLQNTAYTTSAELPFPALHSYMTVDNVFYDATSWSPSWGGPSGLVRSNLYDLGKWMNAFGNGKLVSAASYQEQTRAISTGHPEMGFALGFMVSNSWFYQNPGINGYKTIAAYFQPLNLSLVITTTDGVTSNPDTHYATLIFPKIAQILAPGYPLVATPN